MRKEFNFWLFCVIWLNDSFQILLLRYWQLIISQLKIKPNTSPSFKKYKKTSSVEKNKKSLTGYADTLKRRLNLA